MYFQEFSHGKLQYLRAHPADFSPERRYPVIFLLHGAGTRGSDLELLKSHAFFAATNKPDFPFVTIAPQCCENTWFDLWESLCQLVRYIAAQPWADRTRLYLMGASMGGYAAWQLAMSLPEYFAAMVPICGGGMAWNTARLKNIPIWAFHGEKDVTVSPWESRNMVDAVNKRGGQARLTLYPENAHDAWTDTFANEEVFRWLLTHENPGAPLPDTAYNDSRKFG